MDFAVPKVSVIIPTKNREQSLAEIFEVLLRQSRPPCEVIIVDQSESDMGRRRIEALFAAAPQPVREALRLVYFHDRTIPGAAGARNRGMDAATGDVWLFLDDDMMPESTFVEELLAVYGMHPAVGGVSGIITNYPRPDWRSRLWMRLFQRGPFRDERQAIYWDADRLREAGPIRVTKFGAGLMSFRAAVVRGVRFDGALSGLPPGEDVDFCTRLAPVVDLVVAPRARIAHNASAIGRDRGYWLREYVQGKLYPYHRNWKRSGWGRIWYLWFRLGCSLVATLACLRRRSMEPWRALSVGVREASRLGSTVGSTSG